MNARTASTCVLIKPDGKTFEAFGFNAETKYSELIAENNHKPWYFFQRFKLMLMNTIHKDTMLVAECGKRLPALRVFSLAIRYMIDDVLEKTAQQVYGFYLKDIRWVLTVPAIWNDAATDFMRLAAQEAGLTLDNITIALEPMAASLYCKELSYKQEERFEFRPGNTFLVLDAGGTVDIAAYEVCFGGKLKELYKTTGGFCGGTMVDKAFEDFFAEITEYMKGYEA